MCKETETVCSFQQCRVTVKWSFEKQLLYIYSVPVDIRHYARLWLLKDEQDMCVCVHVYAHI